MLEAFMILTESMYKKEDQQLLSYGKFQQTYAEAANEYVLRLTILNNCLNIEISITY